MKHFYDYKTCNEHGYHKQVIIIDSNVLFMDILRTTPYSYTTKSMSVSVYINIFVRMKDEQEKIAYFCSISCRVPKRFSKLSNTRDTDVKT